MDNFTIESISVNCAATINDVVVEAQRIANEQKRAITFDFNSVECKVNPDGDPDKLVDEYLVALKKRTAES